MKPSIRELKDALEKAGKLNELMRDIEKSVSEFMTSPDLKLFAYRIPAKQIIHVFARTPSGDQMSLCGKTLPEGAGFWQITRLRTCMCVRCAKRAEEIFAR
jgi:hypothetical protein